MAHVLVVDDEICFARSVGRFLAADGHEVRVAGTLAEARDALASVPFNVVVLDLFLPDGYGSQLLPELKACAPPPQVVVVSGFLTSERAIALFGECALTVPKPVATEGIQTIVTKLASAPADTITVFCRSHRLSGRESELVYLAYAGVENKDVAARLSCSYNTIGTYWKRIFEKTGCRSQRSVLAAALRDACRRD